MACNTVIRPLSQMPDPLSQKPVLSGRPFLPPLSLSYLEHESPILYFLRSYKTWLLLLLCLAGSWIKAQLPLPPTTAFSDARRSGEASITVLWYDIEPFIYRDGKGGIIGVEKELMQGFVPFLKREYGISLRINWVDAGSFAAIYPTIKTSGEKGLFGLSFYSITDERKREVSFSPPYMPDLNVLVTNNNLPSYDTDSAFFRDLPRLKGFTMKQTTMEEDLHRLMKRGHPGLPVSNEADDYELLRQIAVRPNSIGYVPVSIYVVALQRGIKIKRQRILATRREGFAAIYTKGSDWHEPVNAYFNSPECRSLTSRLIRKYLGEEVAGIIRNVSAGDSLSGRPSDIELLMEEREIVTRRLIDTALDAERTRTQRNIFLLAGGAILVIAAVTYSRFRTKNRLNRLLRQRNAVIAEQKEKMLELNRQLNMKILQSKLNPHFLFNSLNAIQYHIGANDKKGALQYITRFAQFLRKVLQSSDEILIPASTEAAMAEQYLWLEHNRFPERFSYRVTVLEGAGESRTPPLLTHSILQNALYSNILNGSKTEPCLLEIEFQMKEDALVITVRDDGAGTYGTDPDHHKTEMRTADTILEHRLAAINASAVKKVTKTTLREDESNHTELTIPQPLFHTINQMPCN